MPSVPARSAPARSVSARRKLLTNALWLYSLQGLNYILPLLVLPYLVRTLGVGGYGTISLAQAVAQYFTVVTDYGFNLSATKRIALARNDDPDAVRQTFWGVLAIKLLLMLVGFLLLLGALALMPSLAGMRAAYLVAYLAVIGNVLFPGWYFQGMERMRTISVLTGIAKIITVGSIFFLVHGPSDLLLALALQSSAPLLAGLAGIAVAARANWAAAALPRRSDLALLLRDGWHLFVSTASVTLYSTTNVVLVGLIGGVTEAGYFSAAEKIIRGAQGLLLPLTQVLFPHVNTLVKESPRAAVRFIRRSLLTIAAPVFTGSLLLLIAAPFLAHLVFGFSNPSTNHTLRWIAFIPFLVAVSNVLGVQTMVVFGYEKAFSRILLSAGLFNLALATTLIRPMGAAGAGAAMLCTEGAITLAMLLFLRHVGINLLRRGAALPA